ncbi:MAG TPA: ABC transporter ATP-binding protein [Candidatus Limnocylindrales bacterium]|nr:ABC transporter ATP-binding protein [Candidatus Limnocylindrales bacterium]
MTTPALSVKNLSKIYSENGINAFSDLSFSVKRGEFVSIIGPSRCGKSTLFDILAGVTDQTSGTIEIHEKIATQRKGKFGYMLQNPLLLPWRTVLQNVILGLDILRVSKSECINKAKSVLKKFGLLEFANLYPDSLSGGMKQRVALIRTVLFQKDFLLLDEPFGALDALTRLNCQMWLQDILKKINPTVLFITHDVREAIFLSDTIYVLSPSPGKIIKKFEIEIPRPRQKKYLTSQNAIKLEQEILSILFKEKNL